MNIRIELQDIISLAEGGRENNENPVLRAIAIATGYSQQNWVIGKMPVFDEYSLRAGVRMPKLYVVSQNDPLTTDFYVLPPAAQIFLQQWFGGQLVGPIEFELPIPKIEAEATGRIYDLTAAMDEGYNDLISIENELQRDFESLKRGLSKFVSEGGKDFGLGPVREGVQKLNAIGQLPVSVIGRELGRLLVLPLGPSGKTRATDDDFETLAR